MLSAAYFSFVLGLSFSLAYGENFKCEYNNICQYGNQYAPSFSSSIKSGFELSQFTISLLGDVTISVNSLTFQLPHAHYYWVPGNYDFYYYWNGNIVINVYIGNIKYAIIAAELHIQIPIHVDIIESPQGYTFISGVTTVYPKGSLDIQIVGLSLGISVSKCALHFQLLDVFNDVIGKASKQWIEEMNKNKGQAGLCSFKAE